VDDSNFYEQSPRRVEMNGRQVVVGPSPTGNFLTTRKVFVPDTGGYARYLEIVRNMTNISLTLNVGEFDNPFADRIAIDPSATGNSYIVVDSLDGQTPPLGHVMKGAAIVPASVTSIDFYAGPYATYMSYGWTAKVMPGETIALMHFVIQRAAGDGEGARAQAEALVNLADPHELDGMSAEERAAVRNFVLP
jgi:hypothetical protein